MATVNNPTYKERPSCEITLGGTVSSASVLVAIKNNDGKGYEASDAAGYRVIGVAEKAGVATDKIVVNAVVVLLKNSSTNALTQADIGGLAYVENKETVCTYAGSTNALVAGKVVDVVAEGVYVDTNIQSVAPISAPK